MGCHLYDISIEKRRGLIFTINKSEELNNNSKEDVDEHFLLLMLLLQSHQISRKHNVEIVTIGARKVHDFGCLLHRTECIVIIVYKKVYLNRESMKHMSVLCRNER
jgi:hypothetical protein